MLGVLAAAAALALTVMLIAEISDTGTAVGGIASSTWTPITSISCFFLGLDAFSAGFAPLSIGFGLAVLLLVSALAGVLGVGLLTVVLGYRPQPLAAAILGLAYGLSLEVVGMNVIVNGLQAPNVVYESLPLWGWWAGHAAYGATLCLVAAQLLARRTPARSPAAAQALTGRSASAS